MKERPILFSAPMVRAILEGGKTQTRRVIKPQPKCEFCGEDGLREWAGVLASHALNHPSSGEINEKVEQLHGHIFPFRGEHGLSSPSCPYGWPGCRLYVKEATWMWCERRPNGKTPKGRQKWRYVPVPKTPPVYVADHSAKPDWGYPIETSAGHLQMWRYKTARFMPRWASRLTLEIADIRVQRVQEISEEDAEAEGCRAADRSSGRECILNPELGSYRLHFQSLWDTINAKRGFGWEKNPWVWAITFKRVTA